MGIKSKVVGFVAAAALTLSMGAGIASAQSTGSTTASTTVRGGNCSVSVGQASVGFGDYRYDGTQYAYEAVPGTSTYQPLSWNIKAGNPKGCDATLSFGGLNSTTTQTSIGLGSFSGTISSTAGSASGPLLGSSFDASNPHTFLNLPTQTVTGSISILGIPPTTMPGYYSGTITATVSNGQ